jgi:hypothetical protein
MSNTRSIGRFFVCIAAQGAGSPLIDGAVTRELHQPHRTGTGVLIRLPFTGHRPTRGLVIGKWHATADAADAARYRWLTHDHADAATRARCRQILARLGTASRNHANALIDAARAVKVEGGDRAGSV